MARTITQIAQQTIGELHVSLISATARIESLEEENQRFREELDRARNGLKDGLKTE